MQIAIASGKGGTGKTTLSVALSTYIARSGVPVNTLDCDVEEPNVNLFLKAEITEQTKVHALIPEVEFSKCTGCGKCEDICEFSAIVMIKKKPLVFPDMCHSCGGCFLVCPTNAISEIKKETGVVKKGNIDKLKYKGGVLKLNEAISPPVITEVKKNISKSTITIIDSPPGTSCPVIESIDGADYIILVTEPTPFGLNDLKLAVGMIRILNYKFGVVINRSDMGDDSVVKYCKEENIDIIAEIPHSKEIAKSYSKGEFVDLFISKYSDQLDNIISVIGINADKNGSKR